MNVPRNVKISCTRCSHPLRLAIEPAKNQKILMSKFGYVIELALCSGNILFKKNKSSKTFETFKL